MLSKEQMIDELVSLVDDWSLDELLLFAKDRVRLDLDELSEIGVYDEFVYEFGDDE